MSPIAQIERKDTKHLVETSYLAGIIAACSIAEPIESIDTFETSSSGSAEDLLSPHEKQFLEHIRINPGMGLSEIYKWLGLSGRRGTSIRKILEKKNHIYIEVQKNTHGWKKIPHLI